jgi:hypothetical protein
MAILMDDVKLLTASRPGLGAIADCSQMALQCFFVDGVMWVIKQLRLICKLSANYS